MMIVRTLFIVMALFSFGRAAAAQVNIDLNVANVLTAIGASQNSKAKSSSSSASARDNSLPAKAFRGMSRSLRVEMQLNLSTLGFYRSSLDGYWGPGTRSAIEFYAREADQIDRLISEEGVIELYQSIIQGKTPSELARLKSDAVQTPVKPTSEGASEASETVASVKEEPKVVSPETLKAMKTLVLQNELQKRAKAYYEDRLEALKDESGLSEVKQLTKRKLAVISKEITRSGEAIEGVMSEVGQDYLTNIYPEMNNWRTTSFRISEIFPRVPFYIPGTKEHGEVLIHPEVSEVGQLLYQFDFIDPDADILISRDSFAVASENILRFIKALDDMQKWADIAQSRGIARAYEKTAFCSPIGQCEEKVEGTSSLELRFSLDREGLPAVIFVRNKGSYSDAFNFSIESALLLSCYIEVMVSVGEAEFLAGSMSDDDLDALFQ